MNYKTIVMTHEQIDFIVVQEIQEALIRNIEDYFVEVRVCESRREHRKLIKSLHRTLSYFMSHDDFVEFMSEIDWPSDIDRDKFEW